MGLARRYRDGFATRVHTEENMYRIKHIVAVAGLALATVIPTHAADRGEPYALVRDGDRVFACPVDPFAA